MKNGKGNAQSGNTAMRNGVPNKPEVFQFPAVRFVPSSIINHGLGWGMRSRSEFHRNCRASSSVGQVARRFLSYFWASVKPLGPNGIAL
jgi:hypothetical protein